MAFFGVTIETIETARNHPNADRLDICTLEGMSFQFITGRDSYKTGDQVLYFPIDSLFPMELMEKLGLTKEKKENGKVVLDEDGNPVIEGTLRGKDHNRLRIVKLRGALSQGLVGDLSLLKPMVDADPDLQKLTVKEIVKKLTTEDITSFLGVEKYDPPPVPCQNGNLHSLPSELTVYDIEGADRFVEASKLLMDLPVCITEKLEGMNFSSTYRPKTEEFFVNQRGYTIIEKPAGERHMFWETSWKLNLFEYMKKISEMFEVEKDDNHYFANFDSLTFYGEFLGPGIQKNIYKLKEHTIRFFDVKIDGRFVPVEVKRNILGGLPMVPILASDVTLREWLDGRTIQEVSNGKSVLNKDILREGIVITPMVEGEHPSIGRLILKQRSPDYLLGEK